jgi:glutathione S-transferase
MQPLVLVSFDLCPYVQRAAIALAEKGVPFERIDVDLANRPDWFKAISPLGKVPLLKVGEAVIFESNVILEYLEETQASPLHPAEPLRRARHRGWMEFGSSILADIWILETTKDAGTFEAKRQLVAEKFGRVEAAIDGGPWFDGARFSLVDCVYAPIFRYFDTFDRFADLGVFDGLPKVRAWRAALAARPSVQGAVAPQYPARLEAFLQRQDGHFARLMRLKAPPRLAAIG